MDKKVKKGVDKEQVMDKKVKKFQVCNFFVQFYFVDYLNMFCF